MTDPGGQSVFLTGNPLIDIFYLGEGWLVLELMAYIALIFMVGFGILTCVLGIKQYCIDLMDRSEPSTQNDSSTSPLIERDMLNDVKIERE